MTAEIEVAIISRAVEELLAYKWSSFHGKVPQLNRMYL